MVSSTCILVKSDDTQTGITMKTYRLCFLYLMVGFLALCSAPVKGQWVSIARKIKSMKTSQADVATVIVDARTFRVYQAVIDTLSSDPKVEIIRRDNAQRLVEFTKGAYTVSMKVDSLANGLSQITASSSHSENSPKQATDITVEAIIRVCNKAGIKCTVEESPDP
jgi:hypothetical protein